MYICNMYIEICTMFIIENSKPYAKHMWNSPANSPLVNNTTEKSSMTKCHLFLNDFTNYKIGKWIIL